MLTQVHSSMKRLDYPVYSFIQKVIIIAYSLEASDIETQWHDYNNKIGLIEDVFIFWFDEMMDDDVANQIVEDIKPLFA